jgi:hypothetical protein
MDTDSDIDGATGLHGLTARASMPACKTSQGDLLGTDSIRAERFEPLHPVADRELRATPGVGGRSRRKAFECGPSAGLTSPPATPVASPDFAGGTRRFCLAARNRSAMVPSL